MNRIQFWYPTPCSDKPFVDKTEVIHKEGSIRVINLEREPYEVQINANGHGFHAIFGSQINGHFLCIPDWNMGCELGPYEDKFWNINAILQSGQIEIDEAYAIGNALDLLKILIKK